MKDDLKSMVTEKQSREEPGCRGWRERVGRVKRAGGGGGEE